MSKHTVSKGPGHQGQIRPDEPHHKGAPHVGRLVCKSCHAIYDRKHWRFDEDLYKEMSRRDDVDAVAMCPGCKAVAEHQFYGELEVIGPAPESAIDPRRQRIFAVEAEMQTNNPLARISDIQFEKGRWHLQTTTAQLAMRIGRELQKAFGGELEIQELPRTDFARVRWIQAPTKVSG